MKKILILLTLTFSFFSFAEEGINIRFLPLADTSNIIFDKGVDYKVLYFFSYGCPYCYDFENYKEHFLNNKTENINFEAIPLTAIPAWVITQKAFYIANGLDIDIRKDILKHVHLDNKKILTKEELYNFFSVNYNVNLNIFNKQYNSMLTRFKEKKAENLADKYEITGTPSIVVIDKNGKTFKSSPTISGGIKDLMASTIYLVTQPIDEK